MLKIIKIHQRQKPLNKLQEFIMNTHDNKPALAYMGVAKCIEQ